MNRSVPGGNGRRLSGKGCKCLPIVAYSGKSFIDAFDKHLLSTYYIPGTVVDTETQQKVRERSFCHAVVVRD